MSGISRRSMMRRGNNGRTAAALTALAALSACSGRGVDAFQTASAPWTPPLGASSLGAAWGKRLSTPGGPAHWSVRWNGHGSRLSASTESDVGATGAGAAATPPASDASPPPAANTQSAAAASSEVNGDFEPGGPTVVLDDPPTDVYDKAITRTLQWLSATAVFGLGLWSMSGPTTAEEFFAGYLVEQSLSVDNLFVFLILFDYFAVPIKAQDRVLNWGIYGAIVMRAIMIGLGAAALENFHAILLVFAGILVYSSVKVLFGGEKEEEEDLEENRIVQFSKSLFDSTDKFDGDRFFTMVEGVKKATPLFICMIAVELSDVVFAVDSIPAVFGVTSNPLVVFTSNIFAIMGLRSLYTILSKAASDLEYLEPAVAIVLGFIGAKMIAEYLGYKIATEVALGVVATLLGGGVGLSVWDKGKESEEAEAEA